MSQSKSSDVDAVVPRHHESEAELIERVSTARRSGINDQATADELLRRAALENKAALDRLGR